MLEIPLSGLLRNGRTRDGLVRISLGNFRVARGGSGHDWEERIEIDHRRGQLLENAQVIDCRLKDVIIDFYAVAFFKTKHIEHVLKDDYFSPVQVYLGEAMGHADLVLKGRISGDHDC